MYICKEISQPRPGFCQRESWTVVDFVDHCVPQLAMRPTEARRQPEQLSIAFPGILLDLGSNLNPFSPRICSIDLKASMS
jgi:hypothetical protein